VADATQALRDEHQVILAVLDCLEAFADQIRTGGKVDGDTARKGIEFIRMFADRCHHAKEEGVLFPALEAKGMPKDRGPIGVMLYEHDVGRRHVQGMEEALSGAESGDERARAALVENALGYVELLRNHIGKENHILFQMADQALVPEEQAQIVEQYVVHEREAVGPGARDKYVAVAEELCTRWKVELHAVRDPRPAC
jgi:hemerythrin-like domain-containing protein